MYKIIFQKTHIDNKTLLDVFFIKNDVKKNVFYSLDVPEDKISFVDNLIKLCKDNVLDKQKYNFVKKEINSLVDDISIELNSINNKIGILNKKLNLIENDKTLINKITLIQEEMANKNLIYYIKDNYLFKQNSQTRVPEILCIYFYSAILKKDYDYLISLDKFWNNCLLKENYSNIEDLFVFIENNGLTITPNGYLFTFRRVVNKEDIKEDKLFEFVSNEWKKCIIDKRDASLYFVMYNGYDYVLTDVKSEDLNSLQDLMKDYFENDRTSPKFTDNHTKKFLYQVGKTYIVTNVDNNIDNYCSYGLHLGSKDYVRNNDWLGSQIIGCIVNPRDIIAVADNASKLRVRKMHIACIISKEELDSFSATMFNYDYEDLCQKDNEEYIVYAFKENYNSAVENEKKVAEIVEEINCFKQKLNEFSRNSDISKDKIISLLTNNYKSNS